MSATKPSPARAESPPPTTAGGDRRPSSPPLPRRHRRRRRRRPRPPSRPPPRTNTPPHTPVPASATNHIPKSIPTAPLAVVRIAAHTSLATAPRAPAPSVSIYVPVRRQVDHLHAYQSTDGGPRTARTARTTRSGRPLLLPLLLLMLVVVVGAGRSDGDGARAVVIDDPSTLPAGLYRGSTPF
jgi:hypothetical protein